MFCTNCEFEIKGDDRKECPVCGGPLIDYSEVKTSSEEITSALGTDRQEETRNKEKETLPFDLGKALETDDEHPVQEPEEHISLSSPVDPEPQSDATGEERSAEDLPWTDLDKSRWETERWQEAPNEEKETLPFDLGKALETDDEHPVQEPEEHISLSSPVDPEPQSDATGEERSAEDLPWTDLDKSRWETERWQEAPNEEKETLPFDLGKALETDDEHPVQEPEEPSPLLSQLETEREPEAAGTPRSTEKVVPDTPDNYSNLPEQIIAAAQQTEMKPPHSSRKQLALSVMAVLALVAAITTIAIFKPQQYLYPDLGPITTKTEKAALKILSMLTQREEEKGVTQKTPEQGTRVQQREHAAGNADPDKKRSQLEELSSTNKEKAATAKKQLTNDYRKPLAKQETHHARIASLKATAPPFVGKDMDAFAVKPSTEKTLRRKTIPQKPVAKETSQNSLYSLHTGSFKNKEVATGEIDRLQKMGFRAYLQTVDLENGQTWHRIKVGSYSTREEAENTQSELRQQVPKLKSYIMRRVTEPGKTAMQRKGETSIGTGEITPFVSGKVTRELPHEKSDSSETTPLFRQTIMPEIEPPITEMKSVSYLTPLSEEAHQGVSEDSEALPLLKENLVPEIEQLITEMAGNPFTTLLVGEEIPPEDAGSMGTIPADMHQKENHPPTENTVPEDMVEEGKEVVTSVE